MNFLKELKKLHGSAPLEREELELLRQQLKVYINHKCRINSESGPIDGTITAVRCRYAVTQGHLEFIVRTAPDSTRYVGIFSDDLEVYEKDESYTYEAYKEDQRLRTKKELSIDSAKAQKAKYLKHVGKNLTWDRIMSSGKVVATFGRIVGVIVDRRGGQIFYRINYETEGGTKTAYKPANDESIILYALDKEGKELNTKARERAARYLIRERKDNYRIAEELTADFEKVVEDFEKARKAYLRKWSELSTVLKKLDAEGVEPPANARELLFNGKEVADGIANS